MMRSKKKNKRYSSYPYKSKKQMRHSNRKKRSQMPLCCTNNYLKMHNKPMFKRGIRDKIIIAAALAGCDIDGDIIEYAGNKYYVHSMMGIVLRNVKRILD